MGSGSSGYDRISGYKKNLIIALHDSGHGPSEIAHSLGVSRTTIYYSLHPERYERKLDYMRRIRSVWMPEHDPWELEDG